MVYLFKWELSNNKLIFIAISSIYGFNINTSFLVCKQLGFCPNLKIKQLIIKQIVQINKKIGKLNKK